MKSEKSFDTQDKLKIEKANIKQESKAKQANDKIDKDPKVIKIKEEVERLANDIAEAKKR
jgi:dephospho-CoA kinase